MLNEKKLFSYIKQSVDELLERGGFDNGQPFRRTQKEALEAYKSYLNLPNLSVPEKLKGFFEIPTGVGKTALFSAIVATTHKIAQHDGNDLRVCIVVPTKSLLRQTKKDFGNFAPTLKDKVGLYGGGVKDLSLPITIMTYDAWYDLSREKIISSDNIDILISDEAHKGTSERRIQNINGTFNSQVAQIAFTATAHFDEVKSVNKTHEREIFSKSIRDAMLQGADELSSYVQGQTIVIRVEPTDFLLSDEFKEAAKTDQIQYRRRIKHDAWNQYALKAFRDGFDEHTGDRLTDNQAAFFVDGIAQANKLQTMLNADEKLRRRANEQGYTAVAMAIHSKMSDAEQERRFKAYREGQYLAIIGDEMFKEGFDHAPLKTIIDYSHGSIVDKAQILGRGTRYWWNDAKTRSEGLTVIDTVVYIGSNVYEVDLQNRKAALRNIVSVKEILEESRLLGPGSPERKNDRYSGVRDIFGDDPNVEYYADIQDIYKLENEISRIRRENFIDITEEMYLELIFEMERVGKKGNALYTYLKAKEKGGLPQNLSMNSIVSWGSGVKSADKESFEFVMKALSNMSDEFIITEERRSKLTSEMQRLGIKSGSLYAYLKTEKILPQDVSVARINGWLSGKTTVCEKEDFEGIVSALEQLPDNFKIQRKNRDNSDNLRNNFRNGSLPELQSKLISEMERTGKKTTALFRYLRENKLLPEKLTTHRINTWVQSGPLIIEKTDCEAVLKVLADLPDKFTITDELRTQLLAQMQRTGIKADSLYSHLKEHDLLSIKIKPSQVNAWAYGTAKVGEKEAFDFVMNAYASLPTDPSQKFQNEGPTP